MFPEKARSFETLYVGSFHAMGELDDRFAAETLNRFNQAVKLPVLRRSPDRYGRDHHGDWALFGGAVSISAIRPTVVS